MTQILIAIAVWCSNENPDSEKAAFYYRNKCTERVVQCMQQRKWKEAELIFCLGVNKEKK